MTQVITQASHQQRSSFVGISENQSKIIRNLIDSHDQLKAAQRRNRHAWNELSQTIGVGPYSRVLFEFLDQALPEVLQ
ncbi:MAG: hypothetical protein E6R03_11230 [Hyphomicrobiaceae bacterium]|nr:MAG: hypothetical protein E6R03_11230 [Hyphomicrobiaceae bacterium]